MNMTSLMRSANTPIYDRVTRPLSTIYDRVTRPLSTIYVLKMMIHKLNRTRKNSKCYKIKESLNVIDGFSLSFQMPVFIKERFTNKDKLGMMVVIMTVNVSMLNLDSTDVQTGINV